MLAEAQNLKNSVEYFKIDPAKKRWRLQMAEAAMTVNEGTRVTRKTISDLKRCKREWFKNLQRPFLENNIFQSWLTVKFGVGCECSSDSDLAARSLSVEYRRRQVIRFFA